MHLLIKIDKAWHIHRHGHTITNIHLFSYNLSLHGNWRRYEHWKKNDSCVHKLGLFWQKLVQLVLLSFVNSIPHNFLSNEWSFMAIWHLSSVAVILHFDQSKRIATRNNTILLITMTLSLLLMYFPVTVFFWQSFLSWAALQMFGFWSTDFFSQCCYCLRF